MFSWEILVSFCIIIYLDYTIAVLACAASRNRICVYVRARGCVCERERGREGDRETISILKITI